MLGRAADGHGSLGEGDVPAFRIHALAVWVYTKGGSRSVGGWVGLATPLVHPPTTAHWQRSRPMGFRERKKEERGDAVAAPVPPAKNGMGIAWHISSLTLCVPPCTYVCAVSCTETDL